MKIWISAETQAEVGEKLRLARVKIKNAVNQKIESKNYEIPLDGCDLIIVLREDNKMNEVIKYSSKKREMDFRLKIDYSKFLEANEIEAEKLHFEALLRSLNILKEKWIKESGLDELILDVKEIGKENNWL